MYVLAQLPSRVAGSNVCNDIHCHNVWLFTLPPVVGSISGRVMLALTSQSFDVTIETQSQDHTCITTTEAMEAFSLETSAGFSHWSIQCVWDKAIQTYF